jgi:hypothetical protein
VGSKVLDVAGGSTANGGNIDIYGSNNTNAQKFYITYVGNGYYKIVNAASKKAVDVKGGSAASGANVQQYSYNGSNAQLWKPEISSNGGVVFVNKVSGKVLDVAGGANRNGANVDVYNSNGTQAQRWYVNQTDLNRISDVVARMLRIAQGYSSPTQYLLMVDTDDTKTVVFQGSRGHWDILYVWDCGSGAPETPTILGEFSVGAKGYSFGEQWGYSCYYYTQFYGDYLFHTGLYYANTWTPMDTAMNIRNSHGCVRLDPPNAKWIWDNADTGTTVVTIE